MRFFLFLNFRHKGGEYDACDAGAVRLYRFQSILHRQLGRQPSRVHDTPSGDERPLELRPALNPGLLSRAPCQSRLAPSPIDRQSTDIFVGHMTVLYTVDGWRMEAWRQHSKTWPPVSALLK